MQLSSLYLYKILKHTRAHNPKARTLISSNKNIRGKKLRRTIDNKNKTSKKGQPSACFKEWGSSIWSPSMGIETNKRQLQWWFWWWNHRFNKIMTMHETLLEYKLEIFTCLGDLLGQLQPCRWSVWLLLSVKKKMNHPGALLWCIFVNKENFPSNSKGYKAMHTYPTKAPWQIISSTKRDDRSWRGWFSIMFIQVSNAS